MNKRKRRRSTAAEEKNDETAQDEAEEEVSTTSSALMRRTTPRSVCPGSSYVAESRAEELESEESFESESRRQAKNGAATKAAGGTQPGRGRDRDGDERAEDPADESARSSPPRASESPSPPTSTAGEDEPDQGPVPFPTKEELARVRATPWAAREDSAFETESSVERVDGREAWLALLPELVNVCNEAARRAAVASDPKCRFFNKPLAADYMHDRLALGTDEPRGFVCRHRATGAMQGFIVLGTFASWDRTLRWSSTDPRAWGVPSYDFTASRASSGSAAKPKPHRRDSSSSLSSAAGTTGSAVGAASKGGTAAASRDDGPGDDGGDDSGDESITAGLNKTQRAVVERKLAALVRAADAAALAALEDAAKEARDDDGRLSARLEATARGIAANAAGDELVEWPRLLEITLLGGLGCGRRLVERVLADPDLTSRPAPRIGAEDATGGATGATANGRPRYEFLVLQATEAAVAFYENRGLVRVGSLAKYRDRRDMPEVAYRHWNDRITVGSHAHGASHMMALDLADPKPRLRQRADAVSGQVRRPDTKKKTTPKKKRPSVAPPVITAESKKRALADVELITRAAVLTNTNVIGGSGVFRELVVLAQGRAGRFGANDAKLERALASGLVVFKSNSCGPSKRVLRVRVLGEPPDYDPRRASTASAKTATPSKGGPGRKRKRPRDDDDDDDDAHGVPLGVVLRLQGEPAEPPRLEARARLGGEARRRSYRVKISPSRLVALVSDKQRILCADKNKKHARHHGQDNREQQQQQQQKKKQRADDAPSPPSPDETKQKKAAPKKKPVEEPKQAAPKKKPVEEPKQAAPKRKPVQEPKQAAPKRKPVQEPKQAAPKRKAVEAPKQAAPKRKAVEAPKKAAPKRRPVQEPKKAAPKRKAVEEPPTSAPPASKKKKPPPPKKSTTKPVPGLPAADESDRPIDVGDTLMFKFDPPVGWLKVHVERKPGKRQILRDAKTRKPIERKFLWIVKCDDGDTLIAALYPERSGQRGSWFRFKARKKPARSRAS